MRRARRANVTSVFPNLAYNFGILLMNFIFSLEATCSRGGSRLGLA